MLWRCYANYRGIAREGGAFFLGRRILRMVIDREMRKRERRSMTARIALPSRS